MLFHDLCNIGVGFLRLMPIFYLRAIYSCSLVHGNQKTTRYRTILMLLTENLTDLTNRHEKDVYTIQNMI